MNRKKTIIICVIIVISMVYWVYGQPLKPPPPSSQPMPRPVPNQPFGSPVVPKDPRIQPKPMDPKVLQEEYQRLQKDRSTREKLLNIQLQEVRKTKEVLRDANTPIGKWMARRDLQSKIMKLNENLKKLEYIENRQKELRRILSETLNESDEAIHPEQRTRIIKRREERYYISPNNPPRFQNSPGLRGTSPKVPGIPGEEIPYYPKDPNIRMPDNQIQREEYLRQLKKQKEELRDRMKTTDDEIRKLEKDLEEKESGKTK